MFVTINWGTYIWGVNTHHVVETSLGYFINPLFTILLGVFVLGERLRRMQWMAVAIGAIAVIVIAVDYGRPPWIALVLATSFGLYGFVKKQAGVGAVESMAVETSAMFMPAVDRLERDRRAGHLAFGRHGAGNTLLLAGTGVVTVMPLLFFAAGHDEAAAQRARPVAVPGAGAAVRGGCRHPARVHAGRRTRRLRPGLGRAGGADRRRPAVPAQRCPGCTSCRVGGRMTHRPGGGAAIVCGPAP